MAELLIEKKNSDLISEPAMHFWGMQCCSGKLYAQVVGERFRMTMAVLDPKSAPNVVRGERDKIVSLIVKRGAYEYLLCVLKHGEIHQVNLNLIFDKGENVLFYVKGHGKVCLSGYQLTESGKDVLNDENGYLCPLVEVESETKKSEHLPQSEAESVSPKRKKKAKKEEDFVTSEDRKMLKSWNAMSNRKKNGEVKVLEFKDDDESDEDFCIGEEESSESQESEEESDEEELEEEIMLLKEEYGEMEDEEEVSKLEPEDKSSSRKRKLEKKSLLQENSVDDKESCDSEIEALSADDTPSPKKKKETENGSEKISKKKKKKLKLNESTSSEKSVTPKKSTPKTPEKAETTPGQNPVQKLEGGIEIQDVIVGKGPLATKGKTVFVFYVGRFQNKEIFDSRTPGKKPFNFKLGNKEVIKGWDIGLQGMRVGGKRKLKIPPSMAYGSSRMEAIPPNSTLFFLVELSAVS